jgi:hypothetical protein
MRFQVRNYCRGDTLYSVWDGRIGSFKIFAGPERSQHNISNKRDKSSLLQNSPEISFL